MPLSGAQLLVGLYRPDGQIRQDLFWDLIGTQPSELDRPVRHLDKSTGRDEGCMMDVAVSKNGSLDFLEDSKRETSSSDPPSSPGTRLCHFVIPHFILVKPPILNTSANEYHKERLGLPHNDGDGVCESVASTSGQVFIGVKDSFDKDGFSFVFSVRYAYR
jgi:hypothetical protein